MKKICTATTLLSLFLLGACSHLHPTRGSVEKKVLQRGWAFIEEESELVNQQTGAPDVNFTSGVVVGNRFIYGSQRFGLMSLNKESGAILWRNRLARGVSSDVFVQENKIFAGSDDGIFRAYHLESGILLWEANLQFPIVGRPAVAQGRVLVGTIDHAMHALDLQTGKSLWTFRRGALANTTIKGGGNATYIAGKFWVGFSDGTLVALEPNDGSASIEKQFIDNPKFMDINAAPVAWKNGILVATYDGNLRYLKQDGSLNWVFPAGGAHSPIVSHLQGGMVFLSSSNGYVYALQDSTAKELWKYPVKKGIPTGIALVSEKGKHTLVVASSDNYVYAFDAISGKFLSENKLGSSSGSYADLALDTDRANRVFLVSHYGRVFEFFINR